MKKKKNYIAKTDFDSSKCSAHEINVDNNDKNRVMIKKENKMEENNNMKRDSFYEASDEDENMNIGNSSDVSEHESSVEYNEKNSVIVKKMEENIENKHLKTENFDEASDEDENMNIGYSSDVSEHEKK